MLLRSEGRRSRKLGVDFYEIVAGSALFLLFLYFFDVVEMFIEPSSALNRFFVLSAGAIGVMIIAAKLPLALRVLRVVWPWLLILAWLAATTRWAAYPEISRTRVLAFALVYLAALGIAVGFRSPRTLTAILVAAFGVIMLADTMALDFDDSYTGIGVRGIHKHKNTAGFWAVLALITSVFALPQLRSLGFRIAAACIASASVVVLVVAKSKTSLGLAAVALCLIPIYTLWVRLEGHRLRHLIMTIMACTLIFAAGASGTKMAKLSELLFGDPTLTNRMAIWAAVQEKIAQSPWRGHGFGSIWGVDEEWNSLAGDYGFYNDAELINEAHNGYLDLVLNGGRVALVLCWLVTTRALWFSLALATSPVVPVSHRWTFCMVHCLLVSMLVHNVTESTVFFPSGHGSYFFLILLAQVERWKAELDAQPQTLRQMQVAPVTAR